MSITCFVDDDAPDKLTYVFGHAGMRFVHVPKGNKHARVYCITKKLLLWALYGSSRPASLFIISESIKEEQQLVPTPMDTNRFNLVFLEPGSVLVSCQGSPLECLQCGVPIEGLNENNVFERGRRLYGEAVLELESLPIPYEVKPVVSDAWDDLNCEGNTGVFWDVVDFPIPGKLDPALTSELIKSGLHRQGCCNGSVSIRLYDVEDEKTKTTKQDLIDEYEATGISFNLVPEVAEAHGYARDHKMLVDILRWAVDNPPNSNLIMLSKHLDESSLSCIQGLQDTGYNNVVLVDTPASSAWSWLHS
ncbi:PREDICTED: uncharacterized protein LOC104721503 [Camelina sativa]|uniref:Uncharacterized protein LOC104721503 n=1 Tax=Camelina sativa TaxID=90675 RepID=A0ABM0U981_CAMSA|nr:PREDICTED: uncharacterized protein LOC104721503 [Camelina sativa]